MIVPNMSRRHFEFIAETIKELRFPVAREVNVAIVANQFANQLAATNVRFKKATFLYACGLSADSAAVQPAALEERRKAA